MSSPGCGFVRAIRATTLAAVMLTVAIGSHVLAGGHQPEMWSIVPAGVLALIAALVTTRWRVGFAPTFGLLATAQIGFHSLAEWCPPWCTTMAHHLVEHSDGSTMQAAHLGAAAVTAAIVVYGDRILWALGEWLARRLILVAPASSVAQNFSAPVVFTRTVPTATPGTEAAARRGPPRTLAFV